MRSNPLCWILLGILVLAGCDSTVNDEGPDVPTLIAPIDGSSKELTVVELQWNTSASSIRYHLQFSTDQGFSSTIVDQDGINGNAYQLFDLELGKPYYWRIRARNENGYSDWTTVQSFTPSYEAKIPPIPSLVAPTDNSLDMPTSVFFRWSPVDGATSYHLQVSLEENFIRRSADMEGIRGITQNVQELVPTYIYYWRVRSINPLGYSNWSPTWELVIEDDL